MQWLAETVARVAEMEPYKSSNDTIAIVAMAMCL